MAELYRFELKKCLQQKVLWITGGILLLCLCLWGGGSLPADHGQRAAGRGDHPSSPRGRRRAGR